MDDRFEKDSTVFNPAKTKPQEPDDWGHAVSPEDKMLKAMIDGRQAHPVFLWMKEMFEPAYQRALKRFEGEK